MCKERMIGSANTAFFASVTAVESSQKLANMMPNNARGFANDSFSVIEALGVEDRKGMQEMAREGEFQRLCAPRHKHSEIRRMRWKMTRWSSTGTKPAKR